MNSVLRNSPWPSVLTGYMNRHTQSTFTLLAELWNMDGMSA